MRLHNSYTNQIEDFKTIDENKVKMYVCGPTVYDNAHLGHARCYITWDVLYRYLKFKGYDVTYCRNVTDVDDKILKKAEKEGKTPEEVSTFWYQRFSESMKALNNLKPDIEPFATKTLGEMISIVKDLINKGYAYEANGDVYFRVKKFPQYGYLSKQPIDQLESGARIEVGEQKEDPLDFALWKKDEKFGYKSPWGVGRPGWHIECSAMSRKYLGKTIDIHAGGADLIFPHHENEIAQSEAVCRCELARYWVHNGFVQVNAEKMSKSLGNFKTIRDILGSYLPETLRFFLLGKHYHSPIDFTAEGMDEAEKAQHRVYSSLMEARKALERASWKKMPLPAELSAEWAALPQAFEAALDDDLNTAQALGQIFSQVRIVNRLLEEKNLRAAESTRDLLEDFLARARDWDAQLGLFGRDPVEFLTELRAMRAARKNLDMDRVEDLLRQRREVRMQKDFTRSDALRRELLDLGVNVRDTPEGQAWDLE